MNVVLKMHWLQCAVSNMRIIKFRGKNHGTWYKGNLVQRAIADGTLYAISSAESPAIENLVEASTIGQFTGLKDKNNMEIYEGDILDVGDDYRLYVNWDSSAASFSLFKVTGHKSNVTLGAATSITYEVVGNIYDNLTLLEVMNIGTTKQPNL